MSETFYGISFRVSKKLIAGIGSEGAMTQCNPTLTALGKKIPIEFHYFGFEGSGYEEKILTLRCFNRKRKFIYVTAPETKIVWALWYIKKINSHLQFGTVEIGIGHNDFINLRKTAKIEIL